jgi:hypothetical protein
MKNTKVIILNFLYNTEKDKKEATPAKSTQPAVVTKSPSSIDDFGAHLNNNQPPIIDSLVEKDDYFHKLFVDSNFNGPDYQDYMNAVEMLKDEPMAESTKFKAAFTGLKAQGITAQQLIDTSEKYVDLLTSKKQVFDTAFKQKWDLTINGSQSNIEKIKSDNDNIDQKMIELTKQKNDNLDQIIQLKNNLDTDSRNLTNKNKSMESSYNEEIAIINENTDKIKKYLL